MGLPLQDFQLRELAKASIIGAGRWVQIINLEGGILIIRFISI